MTKTLRILSKMYKFKKLLAFVFRIFLLLLQEEEDKSFEYIFVIRQDLNENSILIFGMKEKVS